jgi:SPP1 gp7 family putative phage head morphogenesis protein
MTRREAARLRSRFAASHRTEEWYARALRRIADQVGSFVRGFDFDDPSALHLLTETLERYAGLLGPWAEAVARRMLRDVSDADACAWVALSKDMSRSLRTEIAAAPTGVAFREGLRRQVELITSLPLEAAQRVHDLTIEGMLGAKRAAEVADQIMASGEVTRSRATLIARTEVARTASELTRARAEYVGSPGYLWLSVRDSRVRPSHRKLDGKFIRWDDPPIVDEKTQRRAHAGQDIQCFPGSTEVDLRNGCHHIWRSWYKGSLVIIELEGSQAVELTPNHPILTWRGWIPAAEVQVGDYLVQGRVNRNCMLDDDENETVATFDQVFDTLRAVIGCEVKHRVHFDFHGDRPDSDVDTIAVNDMLSRYLASSGLQGISNFSLSRPDRRMVSPGIGGILDVSEPSISGFGDELSPLFGGTFGLLEFVGVQSSAYGSAETLQQSCYDTTVAFKSDCQFEDALSGFIGRFDSRLCGRVVKHPGAFLVPWQSSGICPSSDSSAETIRLNTEFFSDGFKSYTSRKNAGLRVIKIFASEFDGHVYTMEADNGWFAVTSTGVVVKNCRCVPIPQIPDVMRVAA